MAEIKSIFENRPLVMGILNITPDSFSDGGRYLDPEFAVRRGMEMVEEGADILDIGGESTRPGSTPVSTDEELRRILPVIEVLSARTSVPISVDTVKPIVAEAALGAGASMINDVSNLRDGDALARIAAKADAYLILMHSRGTPATMSRLTDYDDVVAEVTAALSYAAEVAVNAGVRRDRIWIDPGIGFAKTAAQSIELLGRLDDMAVLGYPILVGPSRKSFIDEISGANIHQRLGGTAAAVTAAVLFGAAAVRVHDIAEMRQAVLVAAEMRSTRSLKSFPESVEACRHV